MDVINGSYGRGVWLLAVSLCVLPASQATEVLPAAANTCNHINLKKWRSPFGGEMDGPEWKDTPHSWPTTHSETPARYTTGGTVGNLFKRSILPWEAFQGTRNIKDPPHFKCRPGFFIDQAVTYHCGENGGVAELSGQPCKEALDPVCKDVPGWKDYGGNGCSYYVTQGGGGTQDDHNDKALCNWKEGEDDVWWAHRAKAIMEMDHLGFKTDVTSPNAVLVVSSTEGNPLEFKTSDHDDPEPEPFWESEDAALSLKFLKDIGIPVTAEQDDTKTNNLAKAVGLLLTGIKNSVDTELTTIPKAIKDGLKKINGLTIKSHVDKKYGMNAFDACCACGGGQISPLLHDCRGQVHETDGVAPVPCTCPNKPDPTIGCVTSKSMIGVCGAAGACTEVTKDHLEASKTKYTDRSKLYPDLGTSLVKTIVAVAESRAMIPSPKDPEHSPKAGFPQSRLRYFLTPNLGWQKYAQVAIALKRGLGPEVLTMQRMHGMLYKGFVVNAVLTELMDGYRCTTPAEVLRCQQRRSRIRTVLEAVPDPTLSESVKEQMQAETLQIAITGQINTKALEEESHHNPRQHHHQNRHRHTDL